MPATTAQAIAPVERPGLELQAAAVPGYFLSSSVQEEAKGESIGQLALMLEPGEWIGAQGLSAGARYVGNDNSDGYFEPLLRYRMVLDGEARFSTAAIGFGTHASGENKGSSYSATRVGVELGFDARVTGKSRFAELHARLSTSLTALDAEGRYCIDGNRGFGVECPDNTLANTSGEAGGIYPSATAGVSLEFARHLNGPLHGGALGLLASAGSMPRVRSGQQADPALYLAAGLSLSLGLGAAK